MLRFILCQARGVQRVSAWALLVALSACASPTEDATTVNETPETSEAITERTEATSAAEAPLYWAHEKSDLSADPAVTFGRLENGVLYAILPNSEPPGRVSLRMFVRAGSLHETDSQRGLAHFLEHMAFNGTENYPPGEMVEYFQRLGMAFGADTNAHTWWRETVYKLELPSAEAKLLEDGLLLLRDYADRMQLLTEEIEKERGVILAEKLVRESAQRLAYMAEVEFLMPEALIPHRLTIGTEEVIKNAPREEFVDYYSKWYTADRLAIIATGDIDEATLMPYLEKHFAPMPAVESHPEPELGKLPPRGVQARVYRNAELTSTSATIQNVHPVEIAPDTREGRTQSMHRALAHEMLTRRLARLAKEPGAPFKSGVAYGYDWMGFVTNAGIEVESEPEQWAEALAVAEKELRRALEHGFTQTEFREAQARLLNNYEDAARSASTRRSRELADSVVRALGDERVFTHPEQDLMLAEEILGAATLADAHNALKALWANGDRLIFVRGNLDAEVTDEAALAVFEASREEAVEAREEVVVPNFAYEMLGEKGSIAERTEVEDLGITQLVLSNGVRVNYKKTEFEAGTIHVQLRVGGGELELPEGQEALSLLAGLAFIEGGLEAHSKKELDRIFAGQTVGASFSVSPDAFVLGATTTPDDLRAQLALLGAYLIAPGFREEGVRQAHKALPAIYETLRTTPRGVMQNQVQRHLASGDARFGFPEQRAVEPLGSEDLRAWLSEPLASGYLEVAVVGDIEPEALETALSETLGALPPRAAQKPVFSEARQVAFPAGGSASFTFESEIDKAVTLVAYPTADIWDIQLTRRLGFLSDALDERLRVEVRENLGDAYSPYAYNNSSDVYEDYGYLLAVVNCAPEQTGFLAQTVRRLASELAADGITADEFVRIREPRLKGIEDYRRTNGYWLRSVLSSPQEHPERLDWARTMDADFRAITKEEIDALAREYFADEAAVQMLITPANEPEPQS